MKGAKQRKEKKENVIVQCITKYKKLHLNTEKSADKRYMEPIICQQITTNVLITAKHWMLYYFRHFITMSLHVPFNVMKIYTQDMPNDR